MSRMRLDFEGNVAILKFNHPEVMNAIGAQMLDDFADALLELQASPARAVLLTGEGRGFCAGANLQDDSGRERKGGAGYVLRNAYHPLLLSLRDMDMPLVTAVNGAAAGVGMSFALMGDLVCASRNAFFLQAFSRIGLVPDGGSTYLIPRLAGWGRAVELSMLAERLSAEKAESWGLVNRLYEDNDALMDGAMQLAQRLANGPRSLALTRKLYWSTWSNSMEQQLQMESQFQDIAGASGDFQEGVSAFLQKREAQFKGE